MSDARENDGSAGAGTHTPGPIRYYRPECTEAEHPDHWSLEAEPGFRANGIGFCVSGLIYEKDARRLAVCWNQFQRLTTAGIERHTPEQVEAALINADAARLRIESLEAALREAEAGLLFAGADKEYTEHDFVPAPTLALRIVRAALPAAVPVSPTNAQQL